MGNLAREALQRLATMAWGRINKRDKAALARFIEDFAGTREIAEASAVLLKLQAKSEAPHRFPFVGPLALVGVVALAALLMISTPWTPPKTSSTDPSSVEADGIRSRLDGGDVVYVKISTFNERTHSNLVKQIDYLKKLGKQIKGYIVDLRDTPGGLLDQAIAVADDFLEKGAIVLTMGQGGLEDTKRFNAHPGDITDGKPIVIISNGGTAGGAEVVAGALQDHKRASVIGTRSSGNLRNLPREVKYYTPSGRMIQSKGIEPDVVVEREPSWEDTQLQYALNMLRGEPLPPSRK